MSSITKVVTIALLLLTFEGVCQKKHTVLFTYSQSPFLYAPGITWLERIGGPASLYAGLGVFFQQLDLDRVINSTYVHRFNFQYIDIGMAYEFISTGQWTAGVMAGIKTYYSPHYLPVAVDQNTGMPIYYDASGFRPSFGADFGLTTSYHQLTAGVKFDTARNQFRAGLGYRFGKGRD